jgi:hypothetical protein
MNNDKTLIIYAGNPYVPMSPPERLLHVNINEFEKIKEFMEKDFNKSTEDIEGKKWAINNYDTFVSSSPNSPYSGVIIASYSPMKSDLMLQKVS